jgi:hypothetical protein
MVSALLLKDLGLLLEFYISLLPNNDYCAAGMIRTSDCPSVTYDSKFNLEHKPTQSKSDHEEASLLPKGYLSCMHKAPKVFGTQHLCFACRQA